MVKGISYNGENWREFIKSRWTRNLCMQITTKGVTAKNLLEFMQTFKKGSKLWVVVSCGCIPEVWLRRKDARDFYLECMRNSEGSENERYQNIYYAICDGERLCTDDYF